MHEIGMLYQTAETATKYAETNGVDRIQSIRIEIGELSGALPQVFTNYFPYVASQYDCLKDAELDLRTVPGEALCDHCHSMYNVVKQRGACPKCQSKDKTILGGNEIRLLSIAY